LRHSGKSHNIKGFNGLSYSFSNLFPLKSGHKTPAKKGDVLLATKSNNIKADASKKNKVSALHILLRLISLNVFFSQSFYGINGGFSIAV